MAVFKRGFQCWRMNCGRHYKYAANTGNNAGDHLPLPLALLILLGGLLPGSCGTKFRDDIPGTYAAAWSTEFTEARDTIIIKPVPAHGSIVYSITRKTYMLFLKKPEFKMVHWTGTFNDENKTIIINNNGRVLSFDPAGNEMSMGATVYKKL